MPTTPFLIFQGEIGTTRISAMLEAQTLWLSQKQLDVSGVYVLQRTPK